MNVAEWKGDGSEGKDTVGSGVRGLGDRGGGVLWLYVGTCVLEGEDRLW